MPATVIVGAQWGDEGKGKIVDLLAQHSDLVCRYQGGPNAGHTIVVGDETYKIRALPSGIVRGKVCVIGNGCVIDPEVLIAELDEFERRGHSTEKVYVSGNAHLIMPWHIAIDGASERRLGKLAIGTTRRGIGPCYADKAARIGIRVQDILDPKILRQKIEVALAEKNLWLERVYETKPFELGEVAGRLEEHAQRLRPYVADTSLLVDRALKENKSVLFEGAQATLLDLDHGTYPFVTSSNPVAAYAAVGVGIGPQRLDRVLGVSKAYVTRVGEGPFPSEIPGADQEKMRELGGEYGTVTGRIRRCGWLDLVALRYAVRVNGIDQLALTKLDVLSPFRGAAGARALPPAGRCRDRRLPGAPERLPCGGARLRDPARLGRAARTLRDRRRPARRGTALRRVRGAGARRRGDADRHRSRSRQRPRAARARGAHRRGLVRNDAAHGVAAGVERERPVGESRLPGASRRASSPYPPRRASAGTLRPALLRQERRPELVVAGVVALDLESRGDDVPQACAVEQRGHLLGPPVRQRLVADGLVADDVVTPSGAASQA